MNMTTSIPAVAANAASGLLTTKLTQYANSVAAIPYSTITIHCPPHQPPPTL
jgi:hypothetical protein